MDRRGWRATVHGVAAECDLATKQQSSIYEGIPAHHTQDGSENTANRFHPLRGQEPQRGPGHPESPSWAPGRLDFGGDPGLIETASLKSLGPVCGSCRSHLVGLAADCRGNASQRALHPRHTPGPRLLPTRLLFFAFVHFYDREESLLFSVAGLNVERDKSVNNELDFPADTHFPVNPWASL